MVKASKIPSSQEKETHLGVARRMFAQKWDYVAPKGEKVAFGLVGQIVKWNNEKNFGFIRTRDMKDYYCHGSAFLNECGEKDIVKFDVWENFETEQQKAVNVCKHQSAASTTSVISTGKIGRLTKWFDLTQKGIIQVSDATEYRCNWEDFKQYFPCGSTVCFDIIKDNWTSTEAAVNIRKVARHLHHEGVVGRVLKLTRSGGWVSTQVCDSDIYFDGRELARVHMNNIRQRDRITFNVIMEEDGRLTATDINLHSDLVQTRQMVSEAKQLTADFDSAVASTVKKVTAVVDDCASTAASDLPEAPAPVPTEVAAEVRKLEKKLREIRDLEGRHDLDQFQHAKVANKQAYQRRLEPLLLRHPYPWP
jgi:cold shock CspA family protein